MFHGDKGTLAISGDNYTIYDLKGKQVEAIKGTGKDEAHLDNFFDAVRGSAKPNSATVTAARNAANGPATIPDTIAAEAGPARQRSSALRPGVQPARTKRCVRKAGSATAALWVAAA